MVVISKFLPWVPSTEMGQKSYHTKIFLYIFHIKIVVMIFTILPVFKAEINIVFFLIKTSYNFISILP